MCRLEKFGKRGQAKTPALGKTLDAGREGMIRESKQGGREVGPR